MAEVLGAPKVPGEDADAGAAFGAGGDDAGGGFAEGLDDFLGFALGAVHGGPVGAQLDNFLIEAVAAEAVSFLHVEIAVEDDAAEVAELQRAALVEPIDGEADLHRAGAG